MTTEKSRTYTDKEKEKLIKLVALANPLSLPQDFSENNRRVWRAFNLGRDYEREVIKQWLIDQKERA